MRHPKSVEALLQQFTSLPGLGPRMAQRIVEYLLRQPSQVSEKLARSILDVAEKIHHCPMCNADTEGELCDLCADPQRDASQLCVVEHPSAIYAFERAGGYRGRYYAILGVISPLDGVGPEDLKLDGLLERLRSGQVRELVLATNPTMEGEATAQYLADLLSSPDITISRIAHGLPIGADIDFADDVTLNRSLSHRRPV